MTCIFCAGDCKDLNFEYVSSMPSIAILDTKPLRSEKAKVKIRLQICEKCRLVFNADFHSEQINSMYSSENYIVKRPASEQMNRSLIEIYNFILNFANPDTEILEVGSGYGILSNNLSRKVKSVTTFDPCFQSTLEDIPENRTHYQQYFSAEAINGKKFDLIILRHVLEHIPNLKSFLEEVQAVSRPNTFLYVEVPNFNEIVESGRFYDVFHDHVLYFSVDSLKNVLNTYGFRQQEVKSLFSGQHLGVFFQYNPAHIDARLGIHSSNTSENFSRLQRKKSKIVDLLKKENGQLALWGAGAHGCSFIDQMPKEIKAKFNVCYDRDPGKTNRFIPNTNICVVQPTPKSIEVQDAIVIASALHEAEIVRDLESWKFRGRIITTAY